MPTAIRDCASVMEDIIALDEYINNLLRAGINVPVDVQAAMKRLYDGRQRWYQQYRLSNRTTVNLNDPAPTGTPERHSYAEDEPGQIV